MENKLRIECKITSLQNIKTRLIKETKEKVLRICRMLKSNFLYYICFKDEKIINAKKNDIIRECLCDSIQV